MCAARVERTGMATGANRVPIADSIDATFLVRQASFLSDAIVEDARCMRGRSIYLTDTEENSMAGHGIIMTIIIGLIIGVIAKFLMPGRDPGGFIVTAILGIVGSFVGTWIGRALGMYHQGEGAGFLMSVVGAIILLAIYRMIAGRRTA